jgi:2-oxoglutarate ferredoxin oxidoreductase subunit alpha
MVEDAEIVIAAYGVSARIAKSAIDILRKEGIKVGLIRPITLHPFPYASFEKLDYSRVKAILDVEMSIPAQLVYDVKHAVKDRCPIETCLRSGGQIMSRNAVIDAVRKLNEK